MKILFNELSTRAPEKNLQLAVQLLIGDIAFLRSIGNERPIFYTGDYVKVSEFFFGHQQSLQQTGLALPDRDERDLVLAFLQSTQALDNSPTGSHRERSSNTVVKYVDTYLSIADATPTSFSIRSLAWDEWALCFDSNGAPSQPVDIPHVGKPSHNLEQYTQFLEKLISPLARLNNAGAGHLPKARQSNALKKRIESLLERAASKDERRAMFMIVGGAIARVNGYVRCPEVEQKNATDEKLRHIYFNQHLARFLSIDFMHGSFEVCDENGAHLEEINFEGKHLSGPTPDHSIRV